MWSRLWSLCLHGKQTWLPWSVYPELLCGGLVELTQTQHLLMCFLRFSNKVISDISLHTRAGSLPALLLLLSSWQQEHLFQVKNDKICFLGSLESAALSCLSLISTPGSFDLPLVIGSCFLATGLVLPTKKEGGSFQGVG